MRWMVTGGAGFTGINLAKQLILFGHEAIILDNLHRYGSADNLRWLTRFGGYTFTHADIRNPLETERAFVDNLPIDVVVHLAAQVAMSRSIDDPRLDFEVNAIGTFNVCEAVRKCCPEAVLVFSSTNKVYGDLAQLRCEELHTRYVLVDYPLGLPESLPLDFHGPYACSKGAAEAYVRDYARIFSLKTVIFRQSSVYGERQFATVDQGWLTWFILKGIQGEPFAIHGNGKQVRDLLAIDDLVSCYILAVEHIDRAVGSVYNIGGGPANTLSLLELFDFLSAELGKRLQYQCKAPRAADQKVYISDIRKASDDLGWRPRIGIDIGIRRQVRWVRDHLDELMA